MASGAVRRLTMSRRVLLLGVVAATVLVAALFFWSRQSSINEQNFARIENGMTLSQVEAILGPARDESTGALFAATRQEVQQWRSEGNMRDLTSAYLRAGAWMVFDTLASTPVKHQWKTNHVVITVVTDPERRMLDKTFVPVYCESEGLWGLAKRWFRVLGS